MFKRTFLAVACLSFATFFTGCATHVSTGYRGPVYVDRWGPPEVPYYNRWVVETHRPHRDYQRLKHRDQQAYWRWRHSHR
jgi:hypothetical protein